MPKPKSQKKESDGTDLKEADLSVNDKKKETKKYWIKLQDTCLQLNMFRAANTPRPLKRYYHPQHHCHSAVF